jgi:AcrR family transcriptional regulator
LSRQGINLPSGQKPYYLEKMIKKASGTPTGRPKEFCEQAALEAAMLVFAEKGFENASLADLTTAMGINRFSMYASFGSKEQLYVKAMNAFNDARQQGVIETLSGPSARESIEQLLTGVVERFTDKSHGVCFVTQAPLTTEDVSDDTRKLMAKRRAEVETAIRHRLEKALKERELPADVSPADLARFYAVVIQGIALQAQHGATREQMMRVVEVTMANWPERSSGKKKKAK